MNETNSLVIFTKASQMLAEADTIQKAKELKNLALTAADWAKRKGMGEEAIQYCRSYALEAERKMGEMLAQTERANIARDKKKAEFPGVTPPPTLSSLGLTKRESAEAQMLAGIPRETFDKVKTGEKNKADIKRDIKREEVQQKLEKQSLDLPKDKYQVLCADPPWKYDFAETESRAIENQYPTMTLEEICLLKVPATEDSVLFLWATAPKLKEALRVLEAWGFKYVTNAVWDKERIGMGYWFRGQHELLLVGTRGTFSPPTEQNRVSSVFRYRRQQHSEKPDEVYRQIEEMLPKLRRVELFATKKREGWEGWPRIK